MDRDHNIIFPFKPHKLKTKTKIAAQKLKSLLPRFEMLINYGYHFASHKVNTLARMYAERINI